MRVRVLSDNRDNMIDNHNNNFLLIGARPFRPFRLRVHVLSDNRDNMIDNHNNNFLLIGARSFRPFRLRALVFFGFEVSHLMNCCHITEFFTTFAPWIWQPLCAASKTSWNKISVGCLLDIPKFGRRRITS